jgi:hypothetical protein
MKNSAKLVLELKKLNHKLDYINNNDRYLVYNASPLKFAWFNFIGGVFHSLGTLFGTVVVAGILVYFLSRINITKPITDWVEQILSQVQYQQINPQQNSKPSSTIIQK